MFNRSSRAPYAYYADLASDVFFAEHPAEQLGTRAITAVRTITARSFAATTAGIAEGILAPLDESWRSALYYKRSLLLPFAGKAIPVRHLHQR